jgi:bile acid transporter
MVSGFEKVLLALLLFVLMVGMGATLTRESFGRVMRAPRALLVGIFSQFGWMPLIAYGLAVGFDLPTPLALGLVIIGCTPGGTTSNLFTYYARADLPLSISMTVASTVAAVVMMPLLLALYASPLGGGELAIPYGGIVSTLAVMLVPLWVGMWVRARKPHLAATLERLGGYAGVAVLVVLMVSGVVSNSGLFAQIPAGGYVCAVGLGVLGMVLGYAAAVALRLPTPACRAISLETGIQNSPLAIGIITVSFPAAVQDELLLLPLLYALFVLVSAALVTAVFRASAKAAP